MRTTAIVFDSDYTLADSSAGIIECVSHALRQLEIEPPSTETILETIGHTLAETFASFAKPDPEGLWRALEILKQPREAAVYVGHHVVDAIAADRAGIGRVDSRR